MTLGLITYFIFRHRKKLPLIRVAPEAKLPVD